MYYFPPGSLDARPDLHSCDASWFGSYLEAMEEKPLLPARHSPLTFRCLCLPTWGQPWMVRIEELGLGWSLSGRQLTGDGGFEVGEICRRVRRTLSGEESARVTGLLTALCFWDRPTTVDHFGFDGTTWVLEGTDSGRYHVIQRWEPEWGDTFGEFCRLLEELADFGVQPESEESDTCDDAE
jgi:hypothetical protein